MLKHVALLTFLAASTPTNALAVMKPAVKPAVSNGPLRFRGGRTAKALPVLAALLVSAPQAAVAAQ